MAYVIETPNPFEPLTNVKKHVVDEKISINGWLRKQYPGFVEFDVATICVVNGQAVLRKDWDRDIEPNDIVNFVAIPTGPFLLIAAVLIAIIAATVALALSVQAPVTPGEIPASDPVFSTKGQQNTIRLGEPIEVNYGRNRIFPSLAARPYFQYRDNDQYQYSLFCIGQGEYDISQILIGDTDISEFQEVEYEVLGPNEPITLFPANVFTSAEAGDQTLFAPNEPEYVDPGYVGPFPANPSGTDANELQVDVVFLKGIYSVNSDGGLETRSISLEIDYRAIDDAGVPVGAGLWQGFTTPYPAVFTGATTTPQRKTLSKIVPPGRYEVRMRRTDTKDLSYRAGHDAVWEGLRSYIDVAQDYGNVTKLAVVIRATNNLNDRTQLKFNVIATRKLPIRDEDGVWSAPTATRSIMWAFVDVFRSSYGGRIADDTFFDWPAIYALDTIYSARGDNFDWTFRDPITVWEAAKAIVRAGRAVPLLSGSLITVKRDGPLEVPVTFFSEENILDRTFEWNVKLWQVDEYDSVRVEYTEPATGFKQETVLCTLPDGTTDNPQDVRLIGVQDRTQAYREGLYILAVAKYLRENVNFQTGMEGHIPTFGDLVAISHDVPRWGQKGYVVHAIKAPAPEDYHLYVSEPLDWSESGVHQILLRGRKGEVIGPLTARRTEDAQQVIVSVPDSSSSEFDFMLGGTSEPMLFLFGVGDRMTKYAKVVSIEPQGGESIRFTVVNDDPIIHSFDSLTPPPLETEIGPPQTPDLPEIGMVVITQLDGALRTVQIAWTAAFGAQYYVVQTSEDNVNWTNQGTTVRTAIQIQARPGLLYVRVAAVNNGQGPWATASTDVNVLASVSVSEPWTDLSWKISWWEVLNATGYRVKIYDNSGTDPVLKRTEDLAATERTYAGYTYAAAVADSNLVREMLVTVDVLFDTGPSGNPVEVALSNSIPTAPSAPGSVMIGTNTAGTEMDYQLSWTVPEEEDLIRVAVWLDPVDGFDPSSSLPVYDHTEAAPGSAGIPTSTMISIPLVAGAHAAYYWRVAVFDVWGSEIETNITGQQVISAYP